jgi:hypothetical protein
VLRAELAELRGDLKDLRSEFKDSMRMMTWLLATLVVGAQGVVVAAIAVTVGS